MSATKSCVDPRCCRHNIGRFHQPTAPLLLFMHKRLRLRDLKLRALPVSYYRKTSYTFVKVLTLSEGSKSSRKICIRITSKLFVNTVQLTAQSGKRSACWHSSTVHEPPMGLPVGILHGQPMATTEPISAHEQPRGWFSKTAESVGNSNFINGGISLAKDVVAIYALPSNVQAPTSL